MPSCGHQTRRNLQIISYIGTSSATPRRAVRLALILDAARPTATFIYSRKSGAAAMSRSRTIFIRQPRRAFATWVCKISRRATGCRSVYGHCCRRSFAIELALSYASNCLSSDFRGPEEVRIAGTPDMIKSAKMVLGDGLFVAENGCSLVEGDIVVDRGTQFSTLSKCLLSAFRELVTNDGLDIAVVHDRLIGTQHVDAALLSDIGEDRRNGVDLLGAVHPCHDDAARLHSALDELVEFLRVDVVAVDGRRPQRI